MQTWCQVACESVPWRLFCGTVERWGNVRLGVERSLFPSAVRPEWMLLLSRKPSALDFEREQSSYGSENDERESVVGVTMAAFPKGC